MKIAIIGTGVSGNVASWLLKDEHELTIFEKNNYIGGHSNTVNIDYDGKNIDVDTGFIVFNDRTYPNLIKLFQKLKVESYESDMSFGISCKNTSFEFCVKSLSGLFAQLKNICNPRFYKMLFDIYSFNKKATKFVLSQEANNDITLEDFLQNIKVSDYFKKYFLLPMAGAIWSCRDEEMLQYPALSFLKFYHNHGLLTLFNQPQWYTVKGCSKEYVKKLTAEFKDKIKLNCAVKSVVKKDGKIVVTDQDDKQYLFDKVIFANHANQVLQMAKDIDEDVKNILKKFQFNSNVAVLHRDDTFMPERKAAWASWIYLREGEVQSKCSVTYWMNILQDIDNKYPLFVTLNPQHEVLASKIFAQFDYQHPVFDRDSIIAQSEIVDVQGRDGFYYVGAYLDNGFHEDGVNSAIRVCKLLSKKCDDIF